ncbi:hypothetical protein D046_1171 [Vibrio parahaemolyticus V-223/04]|nr:hypothetical protein D052_2611 [Vibrio parahaemolyticus 10290]EVU19936.1 hypothetical protein D046_1171 [Vibrio parahaemolyticus V-223/04]
MAKSYVKHQLKKSPHISGLFRINFKYQSLNSELADLLIQSLSL